MPVSPTHQGARTDSSSATPDDHAADHTILDQVDKDIVTWANAHEAETTAAHGMAAAIAAAVAGYQPLDSDLTSIAALTTTSYGRAFLALADAAAGRTALGLGTAATSASGDFQPVDSDLTAIAALSTTSFGRSLLTAADAAAARTAIGAGTGSGDALVANPLSQFASTTSAQLASVLSDETGSGANVFATSPTLVTPALGTPSAINLANATGFPASGVAAATYGSGSTVPVFAVGADGRVTSVTNTTISVGKNAATRILARQQFR